MLIFYAPRGGCLFLMSMKRTLVLFHIPQGGFVCPSSILREDSSVLCSTRRALIYYVPWCGPLFITLWGESLYSCFARQMLISYVPRWMIISYDLRGWCLLLISSKQIFIYSTRRIFIYHATLGGCFFLLFMKRIFIGDAPWGGCLFLINAEQIPIYYHDLRSRSSFIALAKRMLIPHALRGRYSKQVLRGRSLVFLEASAYLIHP